MAKPAAPAPATRKPRSRQRFEDKREKILDAATLLINENGAKGMTLQEVANAVGLNTTSVTYYFQRKEQLAAAVFEQTLTRLGDIITMAAEAETPQQRVGRLIKFAVGLRAQVLRGASPPLASLAELRTLDDSARAPLEDQYRAVFRRARALFDPPRDAAHKALLTARTHVLLEVVFWLPFWINAYALVDFPNVARRLLDIVNHGIAKPGAAWSPRLIDANDFDGAAASDGRTNFLRVATQLVNDAGYRGASVDRIVAKLNVTKGSFYHHLDAKDDLILECFRRSYARVSKVQTLADAMNGDHWQRLSSAIATLLEIQFGSDWPLMRTSALRALPQTLRDDVMGRSNRMALRFSGVLVDGMASGAVRNVDPLIASQMIMATLNTAYDLRKWASALPHGTAVNFYASTLIDGLFNDRVLAQSADTDAKAPSKRRSSRRGPEN